MLKSKFRFVNVFFMKMRFSVPPPEGRFLYKTQMDYPNFFFTFCTHNLSDICKVNEGAPAVCEMKIGG